MALPEGPRVNLGSGPRAAPGWINLDGSWQARLAGRPCLARVVEWATGRDAGHWSRDVRCHDVRRGLPFADRSVAIVYASHFLEHLTRDEAAFVLREAWRVLQPGGVCRMVVPDLEAAIAAYEIDRRQGRADAADRFVARLHMGEIAPAGPALLRAYRAWTSFDRHKWMYDGASLCALFREAGFAEPAVRPHLESAIPPAWLVEVEPPDRICGGAGVCVEARADA